MIIIKMFIKVYRVLYLNIIFIKGCNYIYFNQQGISFKWYCYLILFCKLRILMYMFLVLFVLNINVKWKKQDFF